MYKTEINNEIIKAIKKELQSQKSQCVYEEKENPGQPTISVRGVLRQEIFKKDKAMCSWVWGIKEIRS